MCRALAVSQHSGTNDRAIAAAARSSSLFGKMGTLSMSTDTDATLEMFARGLEHPNLQHRLGVLEALVAWLSPSPVRVDPVEACSKPQARFLVRQLLSALCSPQYLERLWIVGLHKVLGAATRSERCPTFTPMCVVNLAGEQSSVVK